MDELATKVADLLKDLPWPEAERVLALASHQVKVREQPMPAAPEPEPVFTYKRRGAGTFN